ncbi:MAG: hypothetical protein EOP05_11645, partial [Proteobacteria bacterium]
TPNAYALPGGVIHLTSGLFDTLKTKNGAAFVLGHEIGHFINRDHIRGVGRQLIFAVGASLFGFSNLTSLGAFDSLIARSFDRDQESNADRYAEKLVKQVYGHTWGGEEFFATMAKDESSFTNALSRFSSTHPLSSERLKEIQKTQIGPKLQLQVSTDHFASWTAHCR